MIALVGLNLIFLFLSLAIFLSLSQEYKKLYLFGFGLSIAILSIFSVFKYGANNLTLIDAGMILYQGGLILAFAGGALSCFIATKLAKKN